MENSELLRHWRFRIHRVQIGHYEAGRDFENKHFWLGVPAILFSTLVGTAVFASLSEAVDALPLLWPKIFVGLMSVASAVLISVQTFLRYSEQAESHKIAGASFAHLKHQIELIATLPPGNELELSNRLTNLEEQWDKVRQESPNIPTAIWRKVEKTMTFEKDKSTHPEFGKAVDTRSPS